MPCLKCTWKGVYCPRMCDRGHWHYWGGWWAVLMSVGGLTPCSWSSIAWPNETATFWTLPAIPCAIIAPSCWCKDHPTYLPALSNSLQHSDVLMPAGNWWGTDVAGLWFTAAPSLRTPMEMTMMAMARAWRTTKFNAYELVLLYFYFRDTNGTVIMANKSSCLFVFQDSLVSDSM